MEHNNELVKNEILTTWLKFQDDLKHNLPATQRKNLSFYIQEKYDDRLSLTTSRSQSHMFKLAVLT